MLIQPVLGSARVTLRPLDLADAPALFAIFSDPEVMAYWSSRPHASVAQTEALIATLLDQSAAGAAQHWAIVRTSDNATIGKCGFHSWQGKHRRGDINYILGRPFWGLGYAAEAIRAMLNHGFDSLGLHSIQAGVTPGNHSSTRLLEKLGFRLEGHMKEDYWAEDHFIDSLIFGILQREWEAVRRIGP